jgi:exosortase family protein XrtF
MIWVAKRRFKLSFLRNPVFRFIGMATGLYLVWYFAYEYYVKPSTLFDDYVIDSLVRWGERLLTFFGYTISDYTALDGPLRSHLGIAGSKGVSIGAPCDGAVLFALFIVFVVSYPGSFKHKWWFIPVGLLTIHFINILRVIGLAIIVHINEDWLAFNHDYTFTLIVYAFVFFLWWLWIKKFTQQEKAPTQADS